MNLVICDYKYRSNYKRRSFNRFNGYCWYCAFCFSGTIIQHRYIDIEFSRMNSFQFQLRILYGYGSEMATGRVFCSVLSCLLDLYCWSCPVAQNRTGHYAGHSRFLFFTLKTTPISKHDLFFLYNSLHFYFHEMHTPSTDN